MVAAEAYPPPGVVCFSFRERRCKMVREATLPDAAVAESLSFEVTEVTGMKTLQVDGVDGHRLAGEVAASIAGMLDLPANSPYYIRDQLTARKLSDDDPLGSQIPPTGAQLMVVPKTRLG
jgi:hypothetical protein